MIFVSFQAGFAVVLLLIVVQHGETQYLAPPCQSPWHCRCPYGTACWTPGFTTVCPPVDSECLKMCPVGYVNDEFGCPRCLCNDYGNCPRRDCFPSPPCPNGFKKDARGCPTCICDNPACPVIRCVESCQYGYMSDSNGCQTCTCQENSLCPPFRCGEKCPYGFKTRHGCKICRCNRPHNCPQVTCPDCPNGFNYMTNRNGCQTSCTCKTQIPRSKCIGFTCSFYCQIPWRYFSRIRSCHCTCQQSGQLSSF